MLPIIPDDDACEGETTSPVPAFLDDTLATMTFFRRSGEWDLETAALSPEIARASWLIDSVEQFQEAFPWTSFQQMELTLDDEQLTWVAGQQPRSLLAWLNSRGPRLAWSGGFEATLALCLHWLVPSGELRKTLIPDSGRLILSRDSRMLTLTIWPNLFTDQITVYTFTPAGFRGESFPFRAAAQRNRGKLRRSLLRWEQLTGGAITGWDSELVEGVERYGFLDSAEPR